MHAYVLKKYGGPDATELREVAKPNPGTGELLIRVHAAGLNPIDFKTRQGAARILYRPTLPTVMGRELAGRVAAYGEGVTRFSEGDRVFARVAKEKMGAFAEYACVNESVVAKIPDSLGFDAAAGVPLAGLTALQALRDELRLAPGQWVFISGGAGGVGTFAIQIAKWLGAEVATTASPRGEALVRSLGADQVIDYTQERFEDALHDFDGAFDLIGGDTLTRTFGVVRRGGKVVSIAGLPEPQMARKDLGGRPELAVLFWFVSLPLRLRARRHGVRYRSLFMRPDGAELAELASLIDKGSLKVVLDRTFPFSEIGKAFAYLENGRAKGKVVVRMVEE
jgi:alcohol dehydrogenase